MKSMKRKLVDGAAGVERCIEENLRMRKELREQWHGLIRLRREFKRRIREENSN